MTSVTFSRFLQVMILLLFLPSFLRAQCPANPPFTLCNATLVTGSSQSNPITKVIGLPTNPQPPPSGINSIITDNAFSAAGVRILRVTGPGFDNRNSGAATNTSYAATGDSHYLDWSNDDSTFMLTDQYGTTYVMAFDAKAFQAQRIPCSFDPTAGDLGQMGNCRATTANGTGQKHLIFNNGATPYSNISTTSNSPYAYTTANQIFVFENSDATGVKVYKLNLAPTIANGANPPTLMNGGKPVVDPWASCLPSGTAMSITGQSMKIDLAHAWVNGRLRISLGSTFAFYYNSSNGNCYTFADSFASYTNKAGPTALSFYKSDGVTPWGSSPSPTAGMHSAEISQDGKYGLIIQPSTWDNDGTHCNADCLFIWQIGTNKVIMPDREDGHGAVQSTNFTKMRVTSNSVEEIQSYPLGVPSLANVSVLAAWQPNASDSHFDANSFTATETQYSCGVTYSPGYTTSPGAPETITAPLESEIFCVNNSGSLWRIAHSHTGNKATANFSGSQGYNNMSRSGKYLLFGSEWNGQLGDNTGSICTAWSLCRTDVFLVELNGGTHTAAAPAPPTDLTLIVH